MKRTTDLKMTAPRLEETTNIFDLAEVFQLRVDCWKTISDVAPESYPCGLIEPHDFDRNSIHYVMKHDGKIIAGARLKICHKVEDIPDYEVYLERNVPFTFPIAHYGKLIVSPKFHGLGYSQYFDRIREQRAVSVGAKMILGWTHFNSKRLLYKKQEGFVEGESINLENAPENWDLGDGVIIYKMI